MITFKNKSYYLQERGALQLNPPSQRQNGANPTSATVTMGSGYQRCSNNPPLCTLLKELNKRQKSFSLSEGIHWYHARTALRRIQTWKRWIHSGLVMCFEFCKDQNAGRTELKAIHFHHSHISSIKSPSPRAPRASYEKGACQRHRHLQLHGLNPTCKRNKPPLPHTAFLPKPFFPFPCCSAFC